MGETQKYYFLLSFINLKFKHQMTHSKQLLSDYALKRPIPFC